MRAWIASSDLGSSLYKVLIDEPGDPETGVEIECKGYDEANDLLEALERNVIHIETREEIERNEKRRENRLNEVMESKRKEARQGVPDPRRGYRKFVKP